MSCVSCFQSCVDESVRRSSIISVWAGEATVFEVTAKCTSGGGLPVFASFGRTSRSRRLVERRKATTGTSL